MLDSVIQKRRSGKEHQQDFLESLIKKHSKAGEDKEEDDDNKLTDDQLKDNILTLLVAGHDTTTAGLTWLIKFLAENPPVLENLRVRLFLTTKKDDFKVLIWETELGLMVDFQEEHKKIQANGNGGTNLTWSEVSNMPYTNKVRSSSMLII